MAATKGAMEAAHARPKVDGGSVDSEVARMGDCVATLEAMKTDFVVLRSGLSPAAKAEEERSFVNA